MLRLCTVCRVCVISRAQCDNDCGGASRGACLPVRAVCGVHADDTRVRRGRAQGGVCACIPPYLEPNW
jgi:hypothetical protein